MNKSVQCSFQPICQAFYRSIQYLQQRFPVSLFKVLQREIYTCMGENIFFSMGIVLRVEVQFSGAVVAEDTAERTDVS